MTPVRRASSGAPDPTAERVLEARALAPAVPSEDCDLFAGLDESPPVFAIGELLSGTYEVIGLLGRGSMGQVFEALDRTLERKVAIKASLPGLDPEWLRREARAMARIGHTTTVSVFGMGTHAGTDYLVMEKLCGISLAAHMEARLAVAGPYSVDEALDLLIGAADGLAAVHAAGFCHRDLKPENIVLAPGNRVILIDFGLVHRLSDEAGCTDSISGSPAYMAPEVIVRAVTPETAHLGDLYALGVIAYELLTGAPPFLADDVADVLRLQLTVPPAPLASAREELPAGLTRLIDALLAKEPSERPQAADEVAWQLRALRRRETEASRDKRVSVLIADDDELARNILEMFVREALPECDIRLTDDGGSAIECALARPPHLLLLDHHMPGVTGAEVCMYLRGTQLSERCRVVFVSGDASAEDEALLRQLGVVAFLRKGPHLRKELCALLTSLKLGRSDAAL